ncbi:MAG: response regulator transcription factor [Prolixibacteraceae bacterium]|nr:response regulator transcription factor [Prolixibacteraceae bacterium]MBN2648910.1 response regulator transcription factor [Prolixibacteraceae bacterium]
MKVFIVEDEINGRENLTSILNNFFDDVEIVGFAETVKDAIKRIKATGIDLILLDINLPDGNAFDILNAIDYTRYKLIFITSYSEYAIKAFKYNMVDYIIKPFKISELVKAIHKVSKSTLKEHVSRLNNLLREINSSPKKIKLHTAQKIYLIDIHQVICCEADRAYTTFFINGQSPVVVSTSMNHFEKDLINAGLLRVHRSYIINPKFIKEYKKQGNGSVIMSNKKEINIARSKKKNLYKLFDKST